MGIYQSTAISVQRKVKAMPYICLLLALQVALQSPVVFSSKTGQIAHTSEHTTYSIHPPHGNPPKRHAIIGGVGKNIAENIPFMIENIAEIKKSFDKTVTFIVIDENKDNTEELLRSYAAKTENTYIVKSKTKGARRTERIANARNKVLELSQPYFDDYPYFVTFDLDLKGIKSISINSTIDDYDKWDVATGNTPRGYYDRFALRTPSKNKNCLLKPISCYVPLSVWLPHTHLKQSIPIDFEPQQVLSAFNGLAIYKSKHLKSCRKNADCMYTGHTRSLNEECEHVTFHEKLRNYTDARIMIWPPLTLLMGVELQKKMEKRLQEQ